MTPPSPTTPAPAPRHGLPPARVLIVDDSPEDRLLYQRLLGQDGWTFVEAETGEEGLDLCQTQRPDCVLLDYRLPDLDGLEFLTRMAAIAGLAGVPVIMLTGQGSESLAVQAIKHGVEDYLSKRDLTSDRLGGAIHAALEQRDLARQLQQTRRKYADLVNNVEGIVWEADARTFQFTFVSAQAERMLGYPVAQWLSEPGFWANHVHSEDRAAALNYCAEATREMRPHEFDYRMIAADGRVVWLHDLITVGVENDQPVLLRGLIVDITARKHNEATLEMMRFSVDHAGDSIFWISREGRILYANDAACADRGFSREELLGMTIFALDPDFQSGVWEPHFEELKRRGTLTFETRHRAKDGRVFPVEVNANYVHLGGQEFNFASLRDITERKRAEDQVKASLREKEALLQEIHHRVKNNLQVVASLLSLQSGEIADEPLRAQFRECQGRIRSMALIHEKLYQSETLARVDLKDYLESLTRVVLSTYATQGNIRSELALGAVSTNVDTAVPLGLLVNEVLTNALKYAFPEGRAGTVRVALRPEPEGMFTLILEDDGVGLPPGFQWEEAKTLGMRLIAMFVKQLGADLTFHSRPGQTRLEIRCSGALDALS